MLEVRRATERDVREPRANECGEREAEGHETAAQRGDQSPDIGGQDGGDDGGQAEQCEHAPDPYPRSGELHE